MAITLAREIETRRYAGLEGVDCNARLPDGLFPAHCRMEPAAEALFISAQKSLQVSAR